MSGYPPPLVRQIWTPWNQTSAQAPPEIAHREVVLVPLIP